MMNDENCDDFCCVYCVYDDCNFHVDCSLSMSCLNCCYWSYSQGDSADNSFYVSCSFYQPFKSEHIGDNSFFLQAFQQFQELLRNFEESVLKLKLKHVLDNRHPCYHHQDHYHQLDSKMFDVLSEHTYLELKKNGL